MLRRSHSSVQQFEIQLQGNSGRNEDIVLLSGPALEAAANHLTGQLVLNTLDTSTIKRISVKLIGTMRLRWSDQSGYKQTSQQPLPLRYEKQLYSQELSDFEIPGRVVNSNTASQRATPATSLTNLASYFKHHRNSSSNENMSGGQNSTRPRSSDSSPVISRAASSVNFQELRNNSQNSSNSLNAPSHSTSSAGLNNMPSGSLANLHSANGQGSGHHPTHQVPPGCYRFPFEFYIPGDLNESIEGNRHTQLAYWLVATVERGFMQHTLTAKKHVRIVRTVGVDSYDIAHTVSIENTWPKKVDYKISVPSRAVAIGSQLEVQFAMVPLDKGLKLGRIRAEIVEYVSLATPVAASREEEHVVARQVFETPPDFDHMSDEWELTRMMDVPRSLSRTTQDATIQPYTKINHKFRCFISLINGDGHTSELRASLPITLYISPNIYVTSNAEIDQANTGINPSSGSSKHKHSMSSVNLSGMHHHHKNSEDEDDEPMFNIAPPAPGRSYSSTSNPVDSAAPPTYSHHVYDRLYSTVPTPSESPERSGTSTPWTLSRANSPVSLNNMDANQQAQLAAGLRALAMSRQNSHQNSHQNRPSGSRNDSSVDIAALSRVPSYDQAMNEQASSEAAPKYPE